jgi:hypothetical protein
MPSSLDDELTNEQRLQVVTEARDLAGDIIQFLNDKPAGVAFHAAMYAFAIVFQGTRRPEVPLDEALTAINKAIIQFIGRMDIFATEVLDEDTDDVRH